MAGMVYLVGAGPGAPDLITLRAVQILRQADVILYDGLVNEHLLQHAKPGAIVKCVGKRGHGGEWKQAEIAQATIDYANQYANVVRLKGGDTAIFARTVEELESLAAQGIDCEIVPGITTASAATAYAGIPLTHRDWSSAVAFVTGQTQGADNFKDGEESLDWNALAAFPGTLVLYMGVNNASNWSRRLIEGGRSPTTAVVMIRNCSLPDQEVVSCDLQSISTTLAERPEFRPPILTIVGDVVRSSLGDRLSKRRKEGKMFIVASPEPHASEVVDALRATGLEAVSAPVMTVEASSNDVMIDSVIERLPTFDWIVFSSRFGVRFFMERVFRSYDARVFAGSSLAAVGPATAKAMEEFGLRCDLQPTSSFGATSLMDSLATQVAGKRILVVKTEEGSTALLSRLQELTCLVETIDVYVQSTVPTWPSTILDNIANDNVCGIIVTSSNVGRNAFTLSLSYGPNLHWLCISEKVAAVMKSLGAKKVSVSQRPDFHAIVELANRTAGRELN